MRIEDAATFKMVIAATENSPAGAATTATTHQRAILEEEKLLDEGRTTNNTKMTVEEGKKKEEQVVKDEKGKEKGVQEAEEEEEETEEEEECWFSADSEVYRTCWCHYHVVDCSLLLGVVQQLLMSSATALLSLYRWTDLLTYIHYAMTAFTLIIVNTFFAGMRIKKTILFWPHNLWLIGSVTMIAYFYYERLDVLMSAEVKCPEFLIDAALLAVYSAYLIVAYLSIYASVRSRRFYLDLLDWERTISGGTSPSYSQVSSRSSRSCRQRLRNQLQRRDNAEDAAADDDELLNPLRQTPSPLKPLRSSPLSFWSSPRTTTSPTTTKGESEKLNQTKDVVKNEYHHQDNIQHQQRRNMSKYEYQQQQRIQNRTKQGGPAPPPPSSSFIYRQQQSDNNNQFRQQVSSSSVGRSGSVVSKSKDFVVDGNSSSSPFIKDHLSYPDPVMVGSSSTVLGKRSSPSSMISSSNNNVVHCSPSPEQSSAASIVVMHL